jgi:hypothetical protein
VVLDSLSVLLVTTVRRVLMKTLKLKFNVLKVHSVLQDPALLNLVHQDSSKISYNKLHANHANLESIALTIEIQELSQAQAT